MTKFEGSALIIEDNLELAENMRELLEDVCGRVFIASDAEAGVQIAEGAGFDLAVVDVRLPHGMSGLDLVPRLRRASPGAEIILVTGNATVDTAVAAVRHGVFAYVLKPFDPVDLLTLAERALEQVALRSERVRLAAELEASEALYRGVVDTVEALIVGVDNAGRVTLCNRFALGLSGYTTDAMLGRSFLETCLEPPDQAAMGAALERALRGEIVRDLQFRLRTGTGHERIVRWTFTPLLPRGASATAVLCLGLDVTETLALQRRTVESEAMAAMGVLTTGLAHEIRNPLNAAALQLEALLRIGRKMEDGPTKEQLERRVGVVKTELSRLSSMLNDFLALARPRGIDSRPFDVAQLVEQVVLLKAPVAEELGLALTAELPEGRCMANGDVDKIKQVLLNLVGNAFDAMHEQGYGRVTIAARRDGHGFVEVTITDEGPGLSNEVAAQIFQPFVTTKAAGTGLGLTIVKKLVEMHGGEVSLGPREEARGAVARFTLPEAAEAGGADATG